MKNDTFPFLPFGGWAQRFFGWLFATLITQFLMALAWPFLRIYVHNKQRIRSGAVIVSNHLTMIDSWMIGYAFFPSLRPSFTPWNIPDKKNFFSNPLFSLIFWLSKCIPIKRRGDCEGQYRSLNCFINEGRRGNCITLYLEGTRSRTGRIKKPAIGVGKVVADIGREITPIILKGAADVLPVGSYFPRFWRRVDVYVGEPFRIYPGNIPSQPVDDLSAYVNAAAQAFDGLKKLENKVLGPDPNET